MKYCDLHIQSEIKDLKEIVNFAEQLGFSAIAICNNFESVEKLKELKEAISKLEKKIEVYVGTVVNAKDPIELGKIINKVREEVMVLIVQGGDYSINRSVCENPKVDILANPELNRFDNGLDDVCLRAAVKNDVAIEINFKEILHNYRRSRSYVLEHITKNIEICKDIGTKIIICSGAQDKWSMRDPRELISIANTLGMELNYGFAALSDIPSGILEKNKKILEGKIITKGVEIVE